MTRRIIGKTNSYYVVDLKITLRAEICYGVVRQIDASCDAAKQTKSDMPARNKTSDDLTLHETTIVERVLILPEISRNAYVIPGVSCVLSLPLSFKNGK